MKKMLIALLIVVIFLPYPMSFASNIDWSSMSDQEIATAINEGRAVIASRIPDSKDHLTVVNQNGVEIYLTRKYAIQDEYNGKKYIKMQAVVVNSLDEPISIGDAGCCINGWAVETAGILDIPANRMKQADIKMCLSDANISTLEEIKDVDYHLYAYSSSTFSTLFTFDNFTYVR